MRRPVAAIAVVFALLTGLPASPAEDRSEAELLARTLLSADRGRQRMALRRIVERGKRDMVAPLITLLRYGWRMRTEFGETLKALTGEEFGADWHRWMEWQQIHPEIEPFHGFGRFKAAVLGGVDPNYRKFLPPGVKREIRLEEVAWGGVMAFDGIPSLDFPKHVTAGEATYLVDEELVFGVEIAGDARAYPFRFMDWHEMFNDRIGGRNVTLAYCTLCGSGILFDSTAPGREKPFRFGSSGLLYRSNKLMYDHETHSLWNQFTGRPVVGPLTGSGIELDILPVTISSWKRWREAYPATKVLSMETGFERDYRPGKPYAEYFASPGLMFPAAVTDDRLKPKDFVFALRVAGAEKAWPLTAFEGGKVVNDRLGALDLVLVGDAATRTVRAYRAEGEAFEAIGTGIDLLRSLAGEWRVTEKALVGPAGRILARLPGHIAYWFAWSGYKPGAAFGGAGN